jgi:phosphoglycerate dehydrogenase-like enzyme
MNINIFINIKTHKGSVEKLRSMSGVGEVTVLENPEEEVMTLPEALIADKDIMVCSVAPANFADMARLKFIQLDCAGYSQIYGLGLVQKGIRVANAKGVFDTPIAEWVLAMMINLARDVPGMLRNQARCLWHAEDHYQREVRGSTVGIWGYGAIGREVGRLAAAAGMNVHALQEKWDHRDQSQALIFREPETGDPRGLIPKKIFSHGQEMEFLADLDFLVVTMPLTGKTRGLIGERELAGLKNTAYVLNPARGAIIKEEALLKALDEKWIAGAALDTHYYYPLPATHPLWNYDNVILTPHISGSSGSSNYLERIWHLVLENVERFLTGKPLLNLLTEKQLNGE